jgi:hypothetical protein
LEESGVAAAADRRIDRQQSCKSNAILRSRKKEVILKSKGDHMKKGLLVLILTVGTTAITLGQTPSSPRNHEKAKDEEHLRRINELIKLERSSQSAIDEDIVRRLEKGIFAARVPLSRIGSIPERFPPANLNAILAEDYIRIGADGEIITRQQEIEKPQLSVYSSLVGASIDDLSIRLYGETGIATSLLIIKGNRSGVEEIMKYRVTNVYVKRGNRWQLVSSQLTAGQG